MSQGTDYSPSRIDSAFDAPLCNPYPLLDELSHAYLNQEGRGALGTQLFNLNSRIPGASTRLVPGQTVCVVDVGGTSIKATFCSTDEKGKPSWGPGYEQKRDSLEARANERCPFQPMRGAIDIILEKLWKAEAKDAQTQGRPVRQPTALAVSYSFPGEARVLKEPGVPGIDVVHAPASSNKGGSLLAGMDNQSVAELFLDVLENPRFNSPAIEAVVVGNDTIFVALSHDGSRPAHSGAVMASGVNISLTDRESGVLINTEAGYAGRVPVETYCTQAEKELSARPDWMACCRRMGVYDLIRRLPASQNSEGRIETLPVEDLSGGNMILDWYVVNLGHHLGVHDLRGEALKQNTMLLRGLRRVLKEGKGKVLSNIEAGNFSGLESLPLDEDLKMTMSELARDVHRRAAGIGAIMLAMDSRVSEPSTAMVDSSLHRPSPERRELVSNLANSLSTAPISVVFGEPGNHVPLAAVGSVRAVHAVLHGEQSAATDEFSELGFSWRSRSDTRA